MIEQHDFFISLGSDVSIREKQDLMARCWFSLSKRKRTAAINHKLGDDFIRVTGSLDYGTASIWDNDLLIFLISQLNEAKNQRLEYSRRIKFTGYEFYHFIGKEKRTGGKGYNDLWNMLQRLHFTHVETSIRQEDDSRHNHAFTWLSDIKQITHKGKSVGYEVIMAEWLFEAVQNQDHILKIDKDYFSITGGLDKWLYLFCRKAAGNAHGAWVESFDSIHKKSGSVMRKADFYKALRQVITRQSIPNYHLEETINTRGKRDLIITRDDRKLITNNRL